jgi:hypothetical protein
MQTAICTSPNNGPVMKYIVYKNLKLPLHNITSLRIGLTRKLISRVFPSPVMLTVVTLLLVHDLFEMNSDCKNKK